MVQPYRYNNLQNRKLRKDNKIHTACASGILIAPFEFPTYELGEFSYVTRRLGLRYCCYVSSKNIDYLLTQLNSTQSREPNTYLLTSSACQFWLEFLKAAADFVGVFQLYLMNMNWGIISEGRTGEPIQTYTTDRFGTYVFVKSARLMISV